MIADYFRDQAGWRHLKAAEYPDDGRNAQSAAALESLADYIESGNCDEGLIEGLSRFQPDDVGSLGGEQAAREVSRYGFGYNATSPGQHEEFLADLEATCLSDAYEYASTYGLDPEDGSDEELDPYNVLNQPELDFARRGVNLPLRYFEYRAGSTEQQLVEALESYGEAE